MSESDVRTLINGIEDDVLRDMLGFCLDSKISYYELKIYASNNNMHTWINALDRKLTSHHVRTILNMMDDKQSLNDKEERILAQKALKAEQKYRKRLDRKETKKCNEKRKLGLELL